MAGEADDVGGDPGDGGGVGGLPMRSVLILDWRISISVKKRKLIEQGFGWAKTVGRIRQVMVRGLKKVDQIFVLTMAAYNLTRMRTLGQIRLQAA